MDYLRRTWSVVNLDAVEHNIRALQKRITPGCLQMGVVKADAYGHGDKFIAETATRMGAAWLGVSNVEEALSLRGQGFYQPILVFAPTPAEYAPALGEYHITQTVHSLDYARELHEAAKQAGVVLGVHIKVDSGMSRIGFSPERYGEIAEACDLPCLAPVGIFTHFACSDGGTEDTVAYTEFQFKQYRETVEKLAAMGRTFRLRHCCNSAATAFFPHMHLDMVRPGIMQYGINPGGGEIDIIPAMELYSTVTMVKEIGEGVPVGYSRTYTASGTVKVATIPMGYADGYPRVLSNRGKMLIRGQLVNVIGNVCMDQLMLDVTHIPDVAPGDKVTVVGTDGGHTLTFDEMGEMTGTIAHERMSGVGKRVPRVYVRGGKEVGVVDYVRRNVQALRYQ